MAEAVLEERLTMEEVDARLAARPEGAKRCGSIEAATGVQCWLEAEHTDLPHIRVTHQINDGVTGSLRREDGRLFGLGWATWGPDGELVHLPVRACPHRSGDRASCREDECRAWRAAIVEWARSGRRPGGGDG